MSRVHVPCQKYLDEATTVISIGNYVNIMATDAQAISSYDMKHAG